MATTHKPKNVVISPSTQTEVVELEGNVCSGLGEGGSFMQMAWVLQQFASKLGIKPFPGTFNLEMTGPQWASVAQRLQEAAGIYIEPPEGFCSAKCFRVVLHGQKQQRVEGVVIFPNVSDYPAQKFEVVAAVPVRQTLQLVDRDPVRVQLYIS